MSDFELYRYIDLLIEKYLDRSVYGSDSVKRSRDLEIADRLLQMWRKKYILADSI